jgi:hypothetical protein
VGPRAGLGECRKSRPYRGSISGQRLSGRGKFNSETRFEVLVAVEIDMWVVSEKIEDRACNTFLYATVFNLALGSIQPLVESIPEPCCGYKRPECENLEQSKNYIGIGLPHFSHVRLHSVALS